MAMNRKCLFVAMAHGYEQYIPACDEYMAENNQIFGGNH